jgi:hypothetical protein
MLLLTGARSWWDYPLLATALLTRHTANSHTVLLHGACPDSPDEAGAAIWRALGGHDIPMPADWTAPCRERCKPGHRRPNPHVLLRTRTATGDVGTYCPAAGMYRNEAMVARAVEHRIGGQRVSAVAFLTADSRGAKHCAGLIGAAGIDLALYRTGPYTDPAAASQQTLPLTLLGGTYVPEHLAPEHLNPETAKDRR